MKHLLYSFDLASDLAVVRIDARELVKNIQTKNPEDHPQISSFFFRDFLTPIPVCLTVSHI